MFSLQNEIKFGKELNDWVIQNVLFKVLFPAEFHGQSAVEGAIKLSKEFNQNINKFIDILCDIKWIKSNTVYRYW